MNNIIIPQKSVKNIVENATKQHKDNSKLSKDREEQAFDILHTHMKAVSEALKLAQNMQVMVNHISQKQVDKLVEILSFTGEKSAHSTGQVFGKRRY